jgi:hypothetical protein
MDFADAGDDRYHWRMQSPVFIVGSPRSGTSALVDVLRGIGYYGFHEGNFLTLLHHLNAVVDRHYVWFATDDKRVMVANVDKNDLKRRLSDTIRMIVNQLNPQEPWFDKTGNPEMILAIPTLLELWPSAVFVKAKRRGIENVISRMKKFPAHPFEYHCSNWAKNMAAWRTSREQLSPGCFIEVEQRDMIQQPEQTAQKLCAFLHVEGTKVATAVKIMNTNRPQESTKGSASRTSSLAESGWTTEQVEMFLKHCETEMTAFGYTLDEQYSVSV